MVISVYFCKLLLLKVSSFNCMSGEHKVNCCWSVYVYYYTVDEMSTSIQGNMYIFIHITQYS